MSYQNLSNPDYSPEAAPETGAMYVFSNMVHSYLNLVQQNAFPPAFLQGILKAGNFDVSSDQIKEILLYEVGYLVALAIGVLFIILMTLVGLFFACCRCCGNCGGKMYQKQTKNMTCKRRFMYLFLLIITLVILAGDICAFYSNSKINTSINNSFNAFDDTLENLKKYVNAVPKDVDAIIDSSSVPISQANGSITGIGSVLGGMIQSRIEIKANTTLADIQTMVTSLNDTANTLLTINNTFNTLKDQLDQLVQNLTDVRNKINQTVTECGSSCGGGMDFSELVINSNFNSIPNFSNELRTLNDFLKSDIQSTIQDARKTLNDIPQAVTNQTKKQVQDVQNQLVNIQSKIQDVRKNFDIVDRLHTFNSYFDKAANYSQEYKPHVVKYEYYRWIVGICLSSIILLVVVCNLCGLLFGPCGHRSHVDPTNRNCSSNCGGEFFMAGAGFSFIFAWLLMLITAILFAVGGNVYTSFCKPWKDQQIYQVIDDNIDLNKQLNLSDINLKLGSIYRNCKQDSSLWNTLNLSNLYNLDSYLNISQYTADLTLSLENTKINMDNITFLSDSQRSKLINVSNSGVNSLDFTNITQQEINNITKTNLTSFANQLKNLAARAPTPYSTQLNDEAQFLLAIQASIDGNILPQVKVLNNSIIALQALSDQLLKNLNYTLASIQDAQDFVNTQVVGIIKNETLSYLHMVLGYFESYITWTKLMLTTKMARCGPVAGALSSAEVVTCEYIVDTFNAFWFSIGWCTIFFIPSIILSVKLAKHYRRMKTSDVYESPDDHLEMTSTSQQFLIPRVSGKS